MFDRIQKGLWWDKTLSLVSGCTPVSAACDNCWLAQETAVRGCQSNEKIKYRYGGLVKDGKFTGVVREMWGDLEKITPKQKPAVWAVWSDLFHLDVSWNFQFKSLLKMTQCKNHFFIVCSKRAPHMRNTIDTINFHLDRNLQNPSRNIMLMTTVENQEAASARIPALISTICRWRGLSVEPLLGPVNLSPWIEKLDWVIVGCESGCNARPMDLDWVRLIRDQCVAAGVPFFFKQAMIDGKLVKAPFFDGRQWLEVPQLEGRQ